MKINNLDDLLCHVGEQDEAGIKRRIYKDTSCGAFVTLNADGITVGSIVEGVDAMTQDHDLTYPFDSGDFWAALEEVEEEAGQIWDETHGCPECWGGDRADEGQWPIDPNCSACGGEGLTI